MNATLSQTARMLTLAIIVIVSINIATAQKNEAIATIIDNTTTSVDFVFTSENGCVNDFIASAIAREEMNDLEGAYSDYSMAIKIENNNAVLYDKRGIVALKLLMYHKAIKDFTKSIELNPTNYETYNHRGIAYYSLENFEKALKDYDKAIEANPEYPKALYNRGLAYYMLDDDQAAYIDFTKASELNYHEAKNILEQFNFESYNK